MSSLRERRSKISTARISRFEHVPSSCGKLLMNNKLIQLRSASSLRKIKTISIESCNGYKYTAECKYTEPKTTFKSPDYEHVGAF